MGNRRREPDTPAVTHTTPPKEADPPIELCGDEGGIWRIITQKSTYVIDLDHMMIERQPGPHASRGINDRERPLRSLTRCKVGRSGYWTMNDDGHLDSNGSYWQASTTILRIERIQPGP